MQKLATHTFTSGSVALMGVAIPAASEPPEWIQLLPAAAGRIETVDSRGPYKVLDAAAIIAASFADVTELPIDENHATDLAAPNGQSAPARGWITAMEARADGIWGKVRWTNSGRELLADQAYRGISPVFMHSADKSVRRILRASLVNNPNLRGLATLHQEESVNFQQKLAEMFGLNAAATEEQILAALPAKPGETAALQAAMPSIAEALGLDKGADLTAVLNAAKAAGADAKTTIPALQSQVTDLSNQLKTLNDNGKLAKAEAFVDAAFKEGRMGLTATNRADFVAMHQADPERIEKLINGFAKNETTHTRAAPPAAAAMQSSANDLVTKAKALQQAEKAKGNNLEWTVAVQMAAEGKQ